MSSVTNNTDFLHVRIAERGKMYGLEGRHVEALRHYREALKLAQSHGAPELFSLHYTQCAMESLELMGEHELVLQYCLEMQQNLEDIPEPSGLQVRHLASTLERQAIQHLYLGDADAACQILERARSLVDGGEMPISETLLGWLRRRYQVDKARLKALQEKHQFFIVRPGKVNPKIALEMPEMGNSLSENHLRKSYP